MAIVSVSGYLPEKQIRALSEEQYVLLRQLCPSLPETRGNENIWCSFPPLIDLDTDGRLLTELGFEFTVQKLRGQISLLQQLAPGQQGPVQTVHVHIPNVGLLAVDEVELLADACTDELQRHLEEGWRILCVCPPNNARRPDYILGQTKPRD